MPSTNRIMMLSIVHLGPDDLDTALDESIKSADIRSFDIGSDDADPELDSLFDIDDESCLQETDRGIETLIVDVEGAGRKQLTINTHSIDEKTNACHMLYQYALDMEGAFMPFVQDVATVLLSLLEFQYSENVRYVSALALSRLLFCIVDAHNFPANLERLNAMGGTNACRQSAFDSFFHPLLHVSGVFLSFGICLCRSYSVSKMKTTLKLKVHLVKQYLAVFSCRMSTVMISLASLVCLKAQSHKFFKHCPKSP